MGRVCDLYQIDDDIIDKIVTNPEWGHDYISHNYASVDGPLHIQGQTVFSIDKAWDIARYLISKFAESKGHSFKILGEEDHDDLFKDILIVIKSDKVRTVNEIIRKLDLSSIGQFYNKDEIKEQCYRGDWLQQIDDYLISHVATIKQAYATAASNGYGLVIRTG